jgi:pectate lyase
MKHISSVKIALALSAACIQSFAAVDFSLVGFAGDVTGGSGGKEVTATNASDFKSYCSSSEKLIIKVSGSISGASTTISSNKTILGVGTSAELSKTTLSIKGGTNIIIRNIKIGKPNREADVFVISGGSNIWIDHCDISSAIGDLNGDGKVDLKGDISGGDVDWYDGLIDMTESCHNITISWNKIHDSFKAMLVGKSDSDLNDRKITFHHNHFYKLWERIPSYRGGTGHVFNNYYQDIDHSGVNARMEAKIRVEGNVFEKVGSAEVDSKTKLAWGPIGAYYSSTKGLWDVKDNLFVDCKGNQPTESTCSFDPPYQYANVLQPASEVKATVLAWSGVGKYDQKPTGINPASRTISQQRTSIARVNKTVYNCRGQKIATQKTLSEETPGVMIIQDYSGVKVSVRGVR